MIFKEMVREKVAIAVEKVTGEKLDNIPINYPERREFGDYATPVVMGLAKKMKKNPREIATTLAEELRKFPDFEKVEVAGPGFINFFLAGSDLDALVREVAKSDDFGNNESQKGRDILLEYVSANPTGPLHIGHGRWAAIGDSMARILRFCGAKVATEFYINDAGNQINMLNDSVNAVKAGKDVPENGYHGEYIKDIAKLDGEPIDNLLAMQQKTLEDFGVHFDRYFSEKSLHSAGAVEATLADLKELGVTYEEEGALWFKTTDFGDDKDRVLVKADGAYTYFAVDIAYHRDKIKRGVTELINVFGADHHGYIARLNAAVKVFSHENVELKIIIGQLVNLFRDGEAVRMSKRTGDMISLRDVMEEIGVDAGRYFLVLRKTDSSLDFDLEVAKKKSEDNPVFYIQYAHARVCGILLKAKERVGWKGVESVDVTQIAENPEARDVVLMLAKFPEALAEMADALEPHRLPQYLEGLAGVFHRWYNVHRVLSEDNDDATTNRRLVLVTAVRNVLKTGLDLLGVSAPDRM